MNARSRAVATAACLLVASACQQPSPRVGAGQLGDSEAVVAEIDGVEIREGELDAWIKEDLFAKQARRGPAKLYELRSDAIGRLIAERVIEATATSRGVDEATLIAEATAALGEVSDEQVASFYEDNQAQMRGASLEDVSDQIRSFLEQNRESDAVNSLLDQASIVVHLEAPRFEIAADGPGRGPDDARITIVEFSDFQCPYCARADDVVKEVMARYPNDVRVVYRHLPLENIHPQARSAAEASACAADQDQFWAYHDKLFENQRQLADEDLQRYAEELGLDTAKFQECVAQRTHREKVDSDAAAAQGAGVTGTPAFFVNGRLLSGSRPAADFVEIIEAELGSGEGVGTESSG